MLLIAIGYSNATSDPLIREASVKVAEWPEGVAPFKVLALSDIHVAGPDMPPDRLVRIVERLNALEPDLVVIAGDLISEKRVATQLYGARDIAKALSGLRAPHGVTVVPGNHDHWAGLSEIEIALRKREISVLRNIAVTRGPINLVLVDDDFTGNADVDASFSSLDRLRAAPVLLVTHSPDIIPELPRKVDAVFAGHTHCGQISLPLVGPIAYMSRYGDRFACGDIMDDEQRVFVSAGLGTSLLPLRFEAPPDAWLITYEGSK